MIDPLRRIFCMFSYLVPLRPMYHYYCNDGTSRGMFKDPSKAIPMPEQVKSSFETNLGLKDLRGEAVDLSVNWQRQILPLIDSLSEKAMDRHRLSRDKIYAYHFNPCEYDKFYLEQTIQEANNHYDLEKFRDTIKALIISIHADPANPRINGYIAEICDHMLGKKNQMCLKKGFHEAHVRMEEWIEDGVPDAS